MNATCRRITLVNSSQWLRTTHDGRRPGRWDGLGRRTRQLPTFKCLLRALPPPPPALPFPLQRQRARIEAVSLAVPGLFLSQTFGSGGILASRACPPTSALLMYLVPVRECLHVCVCPLPQLWQKSWPFLSDVFSFLLFLGGTMVGSGDRTVYLLSEGNRDTPQRRFTAVHCLLCLWSTCCSVRVTRGQSAEVVLLSNPCLAAVQEALLGSRKCGNGMRKGVLQVRTQRRCSMMSAEWGTPGEHERSLWNMGSHLPGQDLATQ